MRMYSLGQAVNEARFIVGQEKKYPVGKTHNEMTNTLENFTCCLCEKLIPIGGKFIKVTDCKFAHAECNKKTAP